MLMVRRLKKVHLQMNYRNKAFGFNFFNFFNF